MRRGSRPHEFPRTGEHKEAKKSTPMDRRPGELPRTARAAADATECAGQVNWQHFMALAELASGRTRVPGDLAAERVGAAAAVASDSPWPDTDPLIGICRGRGAARQIVARRIGVLVGSAHADGAPL